MSKKKQSELHRRIERAESELLHRIENGTIHDGPTLLALMEAASTTLVAATLCDEDEDEDESADEDELELFFSHTPSPLPHGSPPSPPPPAAGLMAAGAAC